ncbi:hypothetical protein SAMN04487820_101508 [Actinopolyspora mzabensis]|uniref:Uncharacterized protein n=1 Tax=Actinopolyspora mzabensis TaxID=995066 RepID=A0A1G8W336_ACTMZ|nr:hypothetical protein [Actinopolyspora mzabensis]SDJ72781.1 hypothetical protein SAMN04487820_101508 [Actinopolyspora mzabensis]
MTGERARLAIALKHEEWVLERVAYDLAGGRATARQCAETAVVLERVARQLREHAAAVSFGGGAVDGVVDAGVLGDEGGGAR